MSTEPRREQRPETTNRRKEDQWEGVRSPKVTHHQNTTPHTTPPTSPPYPHTTYTFFLVTTRPRLVGGRQEKQKLQRAGQGKGNQKIQRYHKHTQPRTLSHHSTLITHSHPLSPNYAFSTCLRPLIRARSRGTCEREAVRSTCEFQPQIFKSCSHREFRRP